MRPYTIGVEEEYQLVDPATRGLVSRARDVLAADWADEAEHEVQRTQLEIATRVCGSAAEIDDELRRLRFHVAAAAASRDLVPVAAGLHPFSDWRDHEATDAPRYRRLLDRYGRVIESEHVFGMHVHVAVPPSVDRMVVINRLRPFLPHLLALSASSPFFLDGDTGYDSYRTVLNDRLPCSGPPPAFDAETDYWAFTAGLIEQDVAVDEGTTYWTVRPHHRYPTIEIRCADVCPSVDDAVAIATLARALVAAAAEGPLPPADAGGTAAPTSTTGGGGDGRFGAGVADAAGAADQWVASRYGLDGRIRTAGGALSSFRDAITTVVGVLGPVARRLGDEAHVAGIHRILERGNGATRMRAVAARHGDWAPLVDWLARETVLGTGMDRRRDQRDGAELAPPRAKSSH